MPRFFVKKESITEEKVYITSDDVKHISKVLRLRAGDVITVCDKYGSDYECEISSISSDCVEATILKREENTAEPDVFITLYQGLPKSDKMDYIIQKCVELGVSEVVPVLTKRAVSRPSESEKKLARWQKISEEAAKQSGRGIVPQICPIITFDEAVREMSDAEDALNIMPYECEKEKHLRDVIKGADEKHINLIIGPEGGFDEAEVGRALAGGIKTITLGPRILRTETAPLAVISAVMYELGDW